MTDEQSKMLVETNTMVKMIYDRLPSYASCERVEAVAEKVDNASSVIHEHIRLHQSMTVNRNMIAGAYLSGLSALIGALYAIFAKKGTP